MVGQSVLREIYFEGIHSWCREMIMQSTINLNLVGFSRSETVLVQHGEIKVSAFRYASGVAALRIINRVGEIIMLPFHGQQIWDAHFYGRRLTTALL